MKFVLKKKIIKLNALVYTSQDNTYLNSKGHIE